MSWTGLCLFWSSLAAWSDAAVPIAFELQHDYVVIADGSIGDWDGLKFVLDTGSNPTVIHARVARQMRLATRPDAINLVGGSIALESAILAELRIGSLRAPNLEVLIKDLTLLDQELGSRIDAILGLDVLARRNFAIDYVRKLLHFDADSGKAAASMDARDGFIAIPVDISGKPVRLVLDTGARGIILFENRIRDRFPRLRVTGAGTSTGLGGKRVDRRVELSSVRIGDYEIGPVQASLINASPETLPGCDGLLGVRAVGVQLKKALELDPDFIPARVFLGLCYERLGRIRDAVSEWNIAIRYSRANPVPVAILGQMCAAACKRTSAGRWVKTLHRLSERRFVPACALAASYTRLGQADKAFEWLEKAFSERSTWLVYMNVDPLLDNVRSDPRFERLVRRVGLPSSE